MKRSFDIETWEVVELKGRECLFNDLRIDRSTIPEGCHMYELADDCDGIPCRMRPGILVNHFGTIVTNEPFEPDDGDTVWLGEEDFIFLGERVGGKEAKAWLNSLSVDMRLWVYSGEGDCTCVETGNWRKVRDAARTRAAEVDGDASLYFILDTQWSARRFTTFGELEGFLVSRLQEN